MQCCARDADANMIRVTVAFATILLFAALATGAETKDGPLEPDRAFRPEAIHQPAGAASADRAGILVTYRIAPGHYLYRDRIRLELLPAGLAVAAPEFASALEMDDPYFGKSSIYREQAVIFLPFAMNVARGGHYRVRITAQGCAEGRFCYSPFIQEVPVSIPDAGRPPAHEPRRAGRP